MFYKFHLLIILQYFCLDNFAISLPVMMVLYPPSLLIILKYLCLDNSAISLSVLTVLYGIDFWNKLTHWVFVFTVPNWFPPSKQPQNSNYFLSIDSNFEDWKIDMAGNHVLVYYQIGSHAEEQHCLWTKAGRQLFSDKTLQHNNLYGK